MSTEAKAIQKKKMKAPPLILLVLGLIIAASILTYIIPAGAFDVNPETKATIAGTFHYIDKTPVTPWWASASSSTAHSSALPPAPCAPTWPRASPVWSCTPAARLSLTASTGPWRTCCGPSPCSKRR